jgi:hypothetical protein
MPSPPNFGCKGQKGSAAAKGSADLVTSKCYTTIDVAERVQISRNKSVLLCNSVYSASSEMFGVHAVSWERLPLLSAVSEFHQSFEVASARPNRSFVSVRSQEASWYRHQLHLPCLHVAF